MNQPIARPAARRLAILRRCTATLGCLLLMLMSSSADELYDFTTTDLRGTPALASYRTGRRSITRSRRRQSQSRQQRQTRKATVRRERHRYVSTRRRLRQPSRTRIAQARDAQGSSPRRTVRQPSQPSPTSKSPRLATAQATPRLPKSSKNKPPRAASQKTTPNRAGTPVLAQAPAEVRLPKPAQAPQEEQAGGEEEVRQNLSLAFVTPRGVPAAGVRLVARVMAAEGEEATSTNLTTDNSGRVELPNIALPAAIDLDFPGEKPAAPGEKPGAPAAETLLEWDFADPDKSTLLLENPLGTSRDTLVPDGSAPTAAPRRVRLFDGRLAPIVLERQVIDLAIAAPAGSTLSSPALEAAQPARSDLTVPASGKLDLRLPREALEDGPISIRVARELDGGEAEAVIESYGTDPYKINAVQSPPLRLARLARLDMAGRVGVMGTRANVARRLGDLKGIENRQNALGTATPLADGSEWWSYPETGIAFKMRLAPGARPDDKRPAMLVERVRLLSANAGSFGTVHVGSTVEQMRASLGEAQPESGKPMLADVLSARGRIDTWLDGGLRVCHDDARVLWLESARPNALLTSGTTAFVRRDKARLFVESFQGNPRIGLASLSDARKYLQQERSVALVGSPDEADFVLQARVSEFKEQTDPAGRRRSFVTRLQYSLFDTDLGRFVAQGKEAQGTATIEMAEQAPQAPASRGGQDEGRSVTLQEAGRARAISAATAFGALVSEVNRAADFSVRVTDIDYATGTLRLNAGRDQGLRESRSDPDDFQITVAGAPLPEEEGKNSSSFYVARVIMVGKDWSVCRLLRVTEHLKERAETFTEEPAPEMVRRLPDPATGQVAARSWRPFPSDTASPAPASSRPVAPYL